ncbi:maleylpyruvate isomerase N-terminal domain-containing protein [Streptomyces sp. NPDC050448]|uniref:maleylpyruvate isomerase N-terminal domain-containing protein n=1 Tax=Streptomyces sp. NPDC050448 TaxID=3155404 RepID=UPI00342233F7
MDHSRSLSHFRNETLAFENAIRRAIAEAGDGPVPLVPSCPGWSAADPLGHLGTVHRFVGRILRDRLSEPPDHSDLTIFGIPDDPAVRAAWPKPETEPNHMQTIEPAVHRWDAESATGTSGPIDAEIAVDAVPQTFETMAPFRRAGTGPPAGAGERYGFRRTDGPESWTVTFSGERVLMEYGVTARWTSRPRARRRT